MARILLAALLALAACLLAALDTSASDVRLRNGGSLVVQTTTCVPGQGEVDAIAAALFAAALNGTGEVERAEYAQAYLCPDGVSLCAPLSVLESFATIEANNSHLVVNGPAAAAAAALGDNATALGAGAGASTLLQSLELLLVQNNTLHLMDAANVTLDRSTVSLGSNNWFYITNSSSLQLNGSRLNFSSYFAFAVDGSAMSLTDSIAEFSDTVVVANSSVLALQDSTWYARSSGAPVPPLYEGKAAPVTWFHETDVAASGSLLVFTDQPLVLLTNSSLLLVNSTLQLVNSSMELWGSPLGLLNSRVELYDGSTLGLFCNSTVVGEGTVAAASYGNGTAGSAPPAAPLLGSQLGGTDSALAQEAYADIYLTA